MVKMANILGIKDKKKIHVNAAALVDLKAALYSKQREVAKERKHTLDSSSTGTRKVSDKTSSIWRNASSKGQGKRGRGGRGNSATSASVKEEEARVLSQQEEEELEKSRRALEAKAALYDRLSRGEGLKELDKTDEEGGASGDGPTYMVDFTRKVYEEDLEKVQSQQPSTGTNSDSVPDKPVEQAVGADSAGKEEVDEEEGQWVEYVDSLGRSRRCLKEDLAEMERRDKKLAEATSRRSQRSATPDLLSDDMCMERERRKWEEQAEREVGVAGEEEEEEEREEDQPVEPVHYQSMQGGEVRSHGVGYYAFSTDTEKRKEEMQMLEKLREQTFSQREKRQQLQEKRKALLDARLAKVRQRKLEKQLKEGGGADVSDVTFDLTDFGEKKEEEAGSEVSTLLADELKKAQEKAQQEEERKAEEKRAAHVRPWDRGKVVDPIRKRKKELEEERPNEFAPPSIYTKIREQARTENTKKARLSAGDPLPTTQEGSGRLESEVSLGTQDEDTTNQDSQQSSAPVPPVFPYYYPTPPPFGVPFPPPPGFVPAYGGGPYVIPPPPVGGGGMQYPMQYYGYPPPPPSQASPLPTAPLQTPFTAAAPPSTSTIHQSTLQTPPTSLAPPTTQSTLQTSHPTARSDLL